MKEDSDFSEDISPFGGVADIPVWTSDDICPGFQSQVVSPHLRGHHLRATDSSDSPPSVTPADLLMASMAAKPLFHILFQA